MKKFALPLFLTERNKYVLGALTFLVAVPMYLLANHYPIFTPQQLPLWKWDKMIPFIPETVFVYVSEYILFVAAYLFSRDMENMNKYIYSFLGLQTISVIIFWVWPTTYPRDLFPLPDNLDWLTFTVFSNLRTVDAPTNCCPSLHVSSVYLSSFIFLDEQKGRFLFFFLWATAVAISTLTTKQHYIVDVIAGLGLAVLSYYIFHKLIPYRKVSWAAKRTGSRSPRSAVRLES
ncbi:phosphatase PAP2 family protein [bacterium]|nr:phosphatase PAP2 family protein [bacterium]